MKYPTKHIRVPKGTEVTFDHFEVMGSTLPESLKSSILQAPTGGRGTATHYYKLTEDLVVPAKLVRGTYVGVIYGLVSTFGATT